jgi:DNA repair ATPase RecN
MGRINVTTYEEHDEILDGITGETEAEKVRKCIEAYPRLKELEDELRHKENKIEELRNQLISANSRIDASNQLVKRVEEQDDDIAETLDSLEQEMQELKDNRGLLSRLF